MWPSPIPALPNICNVLVCNDDPFAEVLLFILHPAPLGGRSVVIRRVLTYISALTFIVKRKRFTTLTATVCVGTVYPIVKNP